MTRRELLHGGTALLPQLPVLPLLSAQATPGPYRQLKPEHAWLRTSRIFALESWWPPFWPHLEVDWDKALSTMRRLHLDTLQANALTKWACYPTDLVQRHPELCARDLLQEAQEFCARASRGGSRRDASPQQSPVSR